jgi:hypothetical protein
MLRANLAIAFDSACRTSGLVFNILRVVVTVELLISSVVVSNASSSQSFAHPAGVPLYPIDIILSSLTTMAPTFSLRA